MKQEIRFLDVIERDIKNRKKKSIKLGAVSVICFIIGIGTVLLLSKIITSETHYFWPIIIIGMLTATVPVAYSTPHILIYMGRRQNRNDWIEITKNVPFNEEITVCNSKIKNYIFVSNMDILSNLLVELLVEDGIKMIITQGEEADKEVKIIYMLSNGMTVTKTFTCFQNDYVKDLMCILSI